MRRLLLNSALGLILGTVVAWIIYFLVGLRLIELLYDSTSLQIADTMLSGRAVTPLTQYYRAANILMLNLTGQVLSLFVIGAFFFVTTIKPGWVVLSSLLILVISFSLFCVLEAYPHLIRTLHLDRTIYYRNSLSSPKRLGKNLA